MLCSRFKLIGHWILAKRPEACRNANQSASSTSRSPLRLQRSVLEFSVVVRHLDFRDGNKTTVPTCDTTCDTSALCRRRPSRRPLATRTGRPAVGLAVGSGRLSRRRKAYPDHRRETAYAAATRSQLQQTWPGHRGDKLSRGTQVHFLGRPGFAGHVTEAILTRAAFILHAAVHRRLIGNSAMAHSKLSDTELWDTMAATSEGIAQIARYQLAITKGRIDPRMQANLLKSDMKALAKLKRQLDAFSAELQRRHSKMGLRRKVQRSR